MQILMLRASKGMCRLREHAYDPELMKLYVVGGGGCLIKNFGRSESNRVIINGDMPYTFSPAYASPLFYHMRYGNPPGKVEILCDSRVEIRLLMVYNKRAENAVPFTALYRLSKFFFPRNSIRNIVSL